MIQIISRIPFRLNRNIINSKFRNGPAVSVLTLNSRQKSSNQSKKTQNLQQKALKLERVQSCPPTPITNDGIKTTSQSHFSSSSSTPPPPPPQGDFTKWILLGGTIAAGAGFYLYNSMNTDDSTSISSSAKKGDKKEEILRLPPTTKDIPKHVPYLLIGGGTASFAAFRAIKSNEPKAKVMVISDEAVMPYMRPPLSKEIWFDTQLGKEQARFKQWNGAERSLYYEPEDFYMPAEKLSETENGGVSVIRGYTVVKLNVAEQKVLLDDGTELTYDKCLIATGSRPKTVDIFDRASAKVKERIHSFKSIKDFEGLKSQIEKSKSVAIVGNGFLGSELSCALSHYGQGGKLKVYQLFHESGNMAKVLPSYLSEWTTAKIREIGVDVQPNSQITGVEIFEGNQLKISLSDGKSLIVDNVIQTVGSTPNVTLAKDAGLELDPRHGGFVVNAELEARTNLYAAGDVACFYDQKLGRRRLEHHDHAVVSGRLAGENMVGLKKPYKHQSMFWSDLGTTVGYEAIGLIDSSLQTTAVFAKRDPNEEKAVPYGEGETKTTIEPTVKPPTTEGLQASSDKPSVLERVQVLTEKPYELKTEEGIKDPAGTTDGPNDFGKGVVFYLDGERIVGILLWNVFNRISIARKILMSNETFTDLNEVAKLFDIFEQHHQDK